MDQVIKLVPLVLPLTVHLRIIANVCSRAWARLRGMTKHVKQHARKAPLSQESSTKVL